MGYIQCCGAKHLSRCFKVQPEAGFLACEIEYLEQCPICGTTTLQISRISINNDISIYRKRNIKAVNFFKKIKHSIICENEAYKMPQISRGKFYLYYNEYGSKKKCYSNLSTIKIGLFENQFFNSPNIL